MTGSILLSLFDTCCCSASLCVHFPSLEISIEGPHVPTRTAVGPTYSTVNLSRALAREVYMRSEEHTSELQSLMRNSYAVFCLKKQHTKDKHNEVTTDKT